MQTHLLKPTSANIRLAAKALADGQLVAFPTETVYGLGAVIGDDAALRAIFRTKGRPSDNPLIVHLGDPDQLSLVARDVSPVAMRLAQQFWPGALTLVLAAHPGVSRIVTAGLDTVAVRIPANSLARQLILAAGQPLAAPSANRSGRPSPTTAHHVLEDFDGRIGWILDGGRCQIGVESTVVDATGDRIKLLRLGGVSADQLAKVVGYVPQIVTGSRASPGTRHRHYAPRCQLFFSAFFGGMVANICSAYDLAVQQGHRVTIIALQPNLPSYGARQVFSVGADNAAYARNIFGALRSLENQNDILIAEGVDPGGIGAAIIERMVRASGGQII